MTRPDAALTAAVLFALLGVCALTWLARRERRRKTDGAVVINVEADKTYEIRGEFTFGEVPIYGDDRGDVLEWDPPTVPASRLNAASGFVTIGGKILHRSCVDDRASGRPVDCPSCAGRLGMATTGGAG